MSLRYQRSKRSLVGLADVGQGNRLDDDHLIGHLVAGYPPFDEAVQDGSAIESREGRMDAADAIGAGDQGMMFGYATNETPEYMPLTTVLAHKLARRLTDARKSGELSYLRPDGKTQVTVAYEDGKPVYVDTVVISTQHDEAVDLATIRKDMIEKVIKVIIPAELLTADTKYFVNPTGKFVIGIAQHVAGDPTPGALVPDLRKGMQRLTASLSAFGAQFFAEPG